MDGSRVKPGLYRATAALLIAACLLACCAVPAQAVVAETVLVGGTLVVATVLVALGFMAISDTRLGEMAQRVVDAAEAAGVPWLTADREIAVLEFGIGVARRVARQVINWVKGWVTNPANAALVGTWRADIELGAVFPLTDDEYIEPEEFVQTTVLSDERFAYLWNNFDVPSPSDAALWATVKENAKFIALGIDSWNGVDGDGTQYCMWVMADDIDYRSVKITSLTSNFVQFSAVTDPEGMGTLVEPAQLRVRAVWLDSGEFKGFYTGGFPGHDPANNEGVVAINYGGPGIVYDGGDLTVGTIGTVFPDWDALGDADTLPLAVPDSLNSLVGVTAEQAQTVQGSDEPEPEPEPSPSPAPLPDEVGGLWQYVRALIDDMAEALSHVGAFITALPAAIVVPVWAGVALMVIIGLLRAFLGG